MLLLEKAWVDWKLQDSALPDKCASSSSFLHI
jgi:hypothetical protein